MRSFSIEKSVMQSPDDSVALKAFYSLPANIQRAILDYPNLISLCLDRYARTGDACEVLFHLLDACPELLTTVDNKIYRESAFGCALLRKQTEACRLMLRVADKNGIACQVLRHRNSSGHTLLMLAVDLDSRDTGGPLIERLLNEWPEQVHTCYDTEGRNVLHHCAVDGRSVSLSIIIEHLLARCTASGEAQAVSALQPVVSAFGVPDSVDRLTPIHYMARSCRLDMLRIVHDFAIRAGLVVNFDQRWPTGQTPLALAAKAGASASRDQVCDWLVRAAGADPRTPLLDAKSDDVQQLLVKYISDLPDSASDDLDDDVEDIEEDGVTQIEATAEGFQRLLIAGNVEGELTRAFRLHLSAGLSAKQDVNQFLAALAVRWPPIADAKEFLSLSAEPINLSLSLMSSSSSPNSTAVEAVKAALVDIGRQDLLTILD